MVFHRYFPSISGGKWDFSSEISFFLKKAGFGEIPEFSWKSENFAISAILAFSTPRNGWNLQGLSTFWRGGSEKCEDLGIPEFQQKFSSFMKSQFSVDSSIISVISALFAPRCRNTSIPYGLLMVSGIHFHKKARFQLISCGKWEIS